MTLSLRQLPLLLFLVVSRAFPAADVPRPDMNDAPEPVAKVLTGAAEQVEAEPGSAEAWGEYAMVLHAHSCETEADLAYAEAQRLDPDGVRWPYFRARLLLAVDPARALQLFDLSIQMDPDYAAAHVWRGLALEAVGRKDDALPSYREAVRLQPENISAHLRLGQAELTSGDLDRAVHHLEIALGGRPDDSAVLSSLAQAYARQGETDRAREMAEAARNSREGRMVDDRRFNEVVLKAVTLQSFLDRANVHFQDGNSDAALRELQRGRDLYGDVGPLHEPLAKLFLTRGEFEQCVESSRIAISSGNDDGGRMYLTMSAALFQLGRIDEADDAVQRALEALPHDATALRFAGQIAAARGNDQQALDRWSRALEVEDDPVVRRWRATAQTRLGRYDEAVAELEMLLAESPGDGQAWLALGEVQRERGDLAAALAAFDRAAQDADVPLAGRQSVLILMEQAEFAEAERRLRTLRAKWPQNPNLINDLAWLLATSPDEEVREGAEALHLVEPLVRQTQRTEPALLDTLAAALAATGRFDEAVRVMDEALALLPDSADDDRRAAFEARRAAYAADQPWRFGGDTH